MRKYIITGILTAIPLWITWLVISFIFRVITGTGLPVVAWLVKIIRTDNPAWDKIVSGRPFQSILAILIIILFLYFLGWLATKVIGRRIIRWFDSLLDNIPLVKTLYTGSKKIIEAFQKKPNETQQVVLINYPSPEMKTVGLLIRTITDQNSGARLGAVYVPTTPNPTSGFLEIVPYEDIIFTDWAVNDAISFVVSGGAVGPEKVNYYRPGNTLPDSGPKKN